MLATFPLPIKIAELAVPGNGPRYLSALTRTPL
jgi:hypothetical protein